MNNRDQCSSYLPAVIKKKKIAKSFAFINLNGEKEDDDEDDDRRRSDKKKTKTKTNHFHKESHDYVCIYNYFHCNKMEIGNWSRNILKKKKLIKNKNKLLFFFIKLTNLINKNNKKR